MSTSDYPGMPVYADGTEPQPPPGWRSLKEHPGDAGPVLLAHRDGVCDIKDEIDYDVMLARLSQTAPYVAWLPLYLDPDSSGDCNHGAIAYPLGWLPLPEAGK